MLCGFNVLIKNVIVGDCNCIRVQVFSFIIITLVKYTFPEIMLKYRNEVQLVKASTLLSL